jgi:hypothetical protein
MMSIKRCVFCGGTLGKNRGKEHYIAEWLLAHQGLGDEQSIARKFDHDLIQEGQRINAFRGNVSGSVCKGCNNGWMSQLEVAVSENVKKLIGGAIGFDQIPPEDRIAISRWACKNAYCWDISLNRVGRVPDEHFKTLKCESDRLPESVVVFGAKSPISINIDLVSDVSWIVNESPQDIVEGLDADINRSYKYAMQFGHMLLVVVYWPNPEFVLGFMPDYVTPIWIPRGRYMLGIPEFFPTFSESRQYLECMTKSIDLYPRNSEGGLAGAIPVTRRPVPRRKTL